MSTSLTPEQVARYREDGILHPVPALSGDEAAVLRDRYLANASAIKGRTNQKPHLLYTWLDNLVRNARILDAVESLHGPDLLCWGAQFFTKPAGDAAYVSWHQDATYWGLSSPDVVTAWVALTPSTVASGCMQVVTGTQHEQVKHEDRFDDANLLSRGQEVAVKVDPSTVVNVELQPGQMSLHHVLLFHGSELNRSDQPRIGFAIRYVPTHVRQLSPIRDSALLVRGRDTYGHFDLERSPVADLDAAALASHADATDRQLRILYAGAQARGKLNPSRGSIDQ
ncbi:MAG: phytanoyl-CoA dioxygenase family protein [Gammaproteobacteria bacterium]|nr:phytanoyl-CoA dioxygenase family protein [Gammaproteobacteria bacterium]MBU1440733.1 phytanoyl-CoA dioxygenase family protein [Gammaproteobacteria bacterium]MBU2287963.1 phytanoyl-CoA dioxygenase family protein [Gammaproteobacteria bacterium]MBU2409834.1 phytanoyl-CoA dioxygenase family protein [Gammaproteobacteria bacterium]